MNDSAKYVLRVINGPDERFYAMSCTEPNAKWLAAETRKVGRLCVVYREVDETQTELET